MRWWWENYQPARYQNRLRSAYNSACQQQWFYLPITCNFVWLLAILSDVLDLLSTQYIWMSCSGSKIVNNNIHELSIFYYLIVLASWCQFNFCSQLSFWDVQLKIFREDNFGTVFSLPNPFRSVNSSDCLRPFFQ